MFQKQNKYGYYVLKSLDTLSIYCFVVWRCHGRAARAACPSTWFRIRKILWKHKNYLRKSHGSPKHVPIFHLSGKIGTLPRPCAIAGESSGILFASNAAQLVSSTVSSNPPPFLPVFINPDVNYSSLII